MEKKVFAFILAFALVISLSACGGSTDATGAEDNSTSSSVTVEKDENTENKTDADSSEAGTDSGKKTEVSNTEASADKGNEKSDKNPASGALNSNAGNPASSGNKPSGSSGNSGNSGSGTNPAHKHSFTIWVPPVMGEHQVSYTEKVPYTVDVPVYDTVEYYQCNECGAIFDTSWDAIDHVTFECGGGYSLKSKQVQTGTKQETRYREETRYKTETYEKVLGYYKCSCGAKK